MSNNLRTRNGVPFNFVNGLKVRGVDIESLIPGIEGIPEAGTKYQFAGNGVQTAFTLPVTPYNKDAVEVHVKQLYVHSTDYSLVGDQVIFTEAPPGLDAGETYNIEIKVNLTVLNGYVNANRVSFEGENLDDILEKSKTLANYSNLRSYGGAATHVRITDPGIAGFFYYDASDTTSADNGGTVIVSGSKRWKRHFVGPMYATWFEVPVAPSNATVSIQKAIDAANALYAVTGGFIELIFPPGRTYLIDIVRLKSGVTIQGQKSIITPTSQTTGRFIGGNIDVSGQPISFLKVKGLKFQQTAGFNYLPCIFLVDGNFVEFEDNEFVGCGYGVKTIRINNVTYRKNRLTEVGIYPRPIASGGDFTAAYNNYGAGLRSEDGDNIEFEDNYFENNTLFGGHVLDITGGAGAFTTYFCNDVTFTGGTAINAPGQGFMAVGEWQFTNVPGNILAGTFDYNLRGRNIRFIGNYARGCNQEGVTAFGCGKVTITGVVSEDNGQAAVESWSSWSVTITGPVIDNKVARSNTISALNIVDNYGCSVSNALIRETRNCGYRVGGSYAVQITGGSILEYGTSDSTDPYFVSGINVGEGHINTDCSTEVSITGVSFKRKPLVNNSGSDIYVNQNNKVVDINGNNAIGREVTVSIGGLTSVQSSPPHVIQETAMSWGNTLRKPVGGLKNQLTTAVSTTATDILKLSVFQSRYSGADGSLCLVNGTMDGNLDNSFVDLVLVMGSWGSGSSVPIIISSVQQGSPAARTYTRGFVAAGGTLRLTMASGTYNVRTSAIQTASGGAGV